MLNSRDSRDLDLDQAHLPVVALVIAIRPGESDVGFTVSNDF